MLTPPLHFAIACAPPQHAASTSSQILYRGAVPIKRNLEFVDRLQLKTILVVSKKEPKADSDVVKWAEGLGLGAAGKGKGKCRKVEIKWIKAGKMEGEELGMGRAEVNEALKVSHLAVTSLMNRLSFNLRITRFTLQMPTVSHTRVLSLALFGN